MSEPWPFEWSKKALKSFKGVKVGDTLYAVCDRDEQQGLYKFKNPEIIRYTVKAISEKAVGRLQLDVQGPAGWRFGWLEEYTTKTHYNVWRSAFTNYWDAYAFLMKLKAKRAE